MPAARRGQPPVPPLRPVVPIRLVVPECEAEETGQAFLLCVEAAFARVDRELNEVYPRALRASDDEAGLRAAQRSWVAYRDATAG